MKIYKTIFNTSSVQLSYDNISVSGIQWRSFETTYGKYENEEINKLVVLLITGLTVEQILDIVDKRYSGYGCDSNKSYWDLQRAIVKELQADDKV